MPSEWITTGREDGVTENFMADAYISDSRRLWHARLGHSNMQRIQRISENPLYQKRGLNLSTKQLTNVKEDFCTSCAMGKSTSKPSITSDAEKEQNPK